MIEEYVSAGKGAGHQEGPGFDSVRDDLVVRAAKLANPPDPDRLISDPVDPGPHLDQEFTEVGDLRLERAQFFRTVSPSAREAAIRRFSVPPTVFFSNSMVAPVSFSAVAWM